MQSYDYLKINFEIDAKITELEIRLQRLCHIRTAARAAIYFHNHDNKTRDELFYAICLPHRNPEIEKFLKRYKEPLQGGESE